MIYAVEEYFTKTQIWQKELNQLRSIILECGLQEELKWKQPDRN